jgi:hypothetical protein
MFQIVSLALGFFAAILFAIPLLKRKEEIEEESSTCWGYNPALRKAMVRDRKFTEAGLLVFSLSFICQILAEITSL